MQYSKLIRNEENRNISESRENLIPQANEEEPQPSTSSYVPLSLGALAENPEDEVYPRGPEEPELDRFTRFIRGVCDEFSEIPQHNKMSFLAILGLLCFTTVIIPEVLESLISVWNDPAEKGFRDAILYINLPLFLALITLYSIYLYLLLAHGNSRASRIHKIKKLGIMILLIIMVGTIFSTLIILVLNLIASLSQFEGEYLIARHTFEITCSCIMLIIAAVAFIKDCKRKPEKLHLFKLLVLLITLFMIIAMIIETRLIYNLYVNGDPAYNTPFRKGQ